MPISSSVLYVVATPIGNLEDISQRALKILREVDIVAAEDTRVSRVLLDRYDIKTPMFSLHKFNERKRGDFFVEKLLGGKNVALISDAGTPCISDPGFMLVKHAHDSGITVTSVCGPSSVMAALSICGYDLSNFSFIGFLPKAREGKKVLEDIISQGGTYVFFESPKRVKKTVKTICDIEGSVDVCLCNDLSKKFERVYRGRASDVLNELIANEHAEKGEYTCVIHIGPQSLPSNDEKPSIEAGIVDIMIKNNLSLQEAADELRARDKKIPKRQIYAAKLRLRDIFRYE